LKNISINIVFPVPTSPDSNRPFGVFSEYISSSLDSVRTSDNDFRSGEYHGISNGRLSCRIRLALCARPSLGWLLILEFAERKFPEEHNHVVVLRVFEVYKSNTSLGRSLLDRSTKLCFVGLQHVALNEILINHEWVGYGNLSRETSYLRNPKQAIEWWKW